MAVFKVMDDHVVLKVGAQSSLPFLTLKHRRAPLNVEPALTQSREFKYNYGSQGDRSCLRWEVASIRLVHSMDTEPRPICFQEDLDITF